MIDPNKAAKLKQFVNNPAMAEAVREVLFTTFTKPRAKLEVTTLAAERIAINLLDDAWKELQRYRNATPSELPEQNTRHL